MKKVLLVGLIFLLVWNGYLTLELDRIKNINNDNQETQVTVLDGVVTSITELVKKNESKLVRIKADKNDGVYREGSGFVYLQNENGVYIVTSNFILENNESLKVEFANGITLDGEIVGIDSVSDIGVVLVKPEFNIESFNISKSNTKIGEYVIALGFNKFQNAASFGIITGFNNNIGADLDEDGLTDWTFNMLQSDTVINNDNNGGALVNLNGDLVGINLSKINLDNRNLALSVSELIPIVNTIISNGYVNRVYLGLKIDIVNELTTYQKSYLGINLEVNKGVYITSLNENSPFYLSGLRVGDVIVSVNDINLNNMTDFNNMIYQLKAGDELKVSYIRNNDSLEMIIKL